VHWTKVYRLPEGARNGKGRPMVNFVELTEGEKVSAIVPVRNLLKISISFLQRAKGLSTRWNFPCLHILVGRESMRLPLMKG
jgi:DNA gyrase/topoisomerase IV subunit A